MEGSELVAPDLVAIDPGGLLTGGGGAAPNEGAASPEAGRMLAPAIAEPSNARRVGVMAALNHP